MDDLQRARSEPSQGHDRPTTGPRPA